MDFGSHDDIEIRYNTDDWGLYQFNFDDAIPATDTLASVTVKAFQGKKKPADTYASPQYTGLTDLTALVIDTDYTPTVHDDTYVAVKFKYPGDDYKGEKVTLIFEITTTNASGDYPFYFHTIRIK